MDFSQRDSTNRSNGQPKSVPAKITNSRRQQNPAYSGPMVSTPGLFDYWRVLFNRKCTVLIAAALGIAAGLITSLPRTRIYQARTTIELQALNDNLLNTRDVNP